MAMVSTRLGSVALCAMFLTACGGSSDNDLTSGSTGAGAQGGSAGAGGGSAATGGVSGSSGHANGGAGAGGAHGGSGGASGSSGHADGGAGGQGTGGKGTGGASTGGNGTGGASTGGNGTGGQATGGSSTGGNGTGGASTGGNGAGGDAAGGASTGGQGTGGDAAGGASTGGQGTGGDAAGGASTGGNGTGGVATGGASAGGQGTGGGSSGAGGGVACCMGDGDCGANQECVNTVCKDKLSDKMCWGQGDCDFPGPVQWTCVGAQVCACNEDCFVDDMPGTCQMASTSGCPATEPDDGDDCTSEGATCQYGQDLRADTCRDTATCKGGEWSLKEPDCDPLPGPGEMGCPKSVTTTPSTCSDKNELCDEGNGAMCVCGVCVGVCPGGPGGGTDFWSCQAAGMQSGCPAIAPDIGQPCDAVTAFGCNYGMCGTDTHVGRSCQNGVWVSKSPGACPG